MLNLLRKYGGQMQRAFRATKIQFRHPEYRFLSNQAQTSKCECMVLHPMGFPNHGLINELFAAEEAIGLISTLGWEIVDGPTIIESNVDVGDMENMELSLEENMKKAKKRKVRKAYLKNEAPQNMQESIERFRYEGIQDGDYIYSPLYMGIYLKGGVIIEEYNNEDEFKGLGTIQNISTEAKKSLIRVRKVSSSTYLTKGKMNEIGLLLKENSADIVFVNDILTPLQQRRLQSRWNDMIKNREQKMRRYYTKVAQTNPGSPTELNTESTIYQTTTDPGLVKEPDLRIIKVVDRFEVILQIFASRAKSRMAQIQLGMAWLKYARTRLIRGHSSTFAMLPHNLNPKALLKEADLPNKEIVSFRGRGGSKATSGGGETELELERRKLKEMEVRYKQELEIETKHMVVQGKERLKSKDTLPIIAIIGYTNAGKTALINRMAGVNMLSTNSLFQTLGTISRKFLLKETGEEGIIIDTVGFISRLPHTLIESFKATLAQIENASIIVHIRDISNPTNLLQKTTVLRVLAEIGINLEEKGTKYIELANKVDLLSDDQLNEIMTREENSSAIPISVLKGHNMERLEEAILSKWDELRERRTRKLEFSYKVYDEHKRWLKIYGNMHILRDDQFEYLDNGNIILTLKMDDPLYQKYLHDFLPDDHCRRKSKEKKGMPPDGWAT